MENPALPQHSLILVEERPAGGDPGFLRIRRVTLRARFEGGEESAPFVYDIIDRDRLDAVVIAAGVEPHEALNDNSTYKALVISGNDSASAGIEKIHLTEDVTVERDLAVCRAAIWVEPAMRVVERVA